MAGTLKIPPYGTQNLQYHNVVINTSGRLPEAFPVWSWVLNLLSIAFLHKAFIIHE